MDPIVFDRLSRLAAVSSRRAVATGLAGALVGLLGGAAPVAAARCKKGKKRCRGKCIPKNNCCSRSQCKPAGSGKVCVRGKCGCPTGQSLCDGVCTRDGACCVGVNCDSVQNGTSVCEEGTCVLTCDPDFAECGGACTPTETCCVGVTCEPVPNGTSGCEEGVCVITGCDEGFADCNLDYADGCEVDLDTDAANCGACDIPCTVQEPGTCGRNGTCVRGTCRLYAPGTTCREATCSGRSTLLRPSSCLGGGTSCPPQPLVPCNAFACRDGACLTRCTTNNDCAAGARCNQPFNDQCSF